MRCPSVACGTASWTQSATQIFSRSHDAVIRVYDEAGKLFETHDRAWRFQRVVSTLVTVPLDSAS
jgi:hypothetical protein